MDGVPAEAQRWEVRDGDVVIAEAALWRAWGGRYQLALEVDAAHRGHGHGSRLFAQAMAAARDARSVQIGPRADDEESIAFAAKRGFAAAMRMQHLALDLAAAPDVALHEVLDRLASSAIAIVTFADFSARSKDPFGAYLDLFESARDGWPDADPEIDWSEALAEREDPHAIVAEQRGRLVGFAGAFGTGVRPDVRGMGIATALEVCAIDAAIARGETALATVTGDPAMRHIAEKLGYRETWCEQRMVRRLA